VKQAARTSLLSRRWRYAWKHSPKLILDIVAMCGDGRAFVYRELYVQRFIDAVDEILRQRRGGAVEELELRFDESHLPQGFQPSGCLDTFRGLVEGDKCETSRVGNLAWSLSL
jgi:hypothetical protein